MPKMIASALLPLASAGAEICGLVYATGQHKRARKFTFIDN